MPLVVILTITMAHQRTLIREAVIARLTNRTAADARVHDSKVDPYRKGQLPTISVYTLSEPAGPTDSSPRELERDCKVEIAGWVRGLDEAAVARAMDDLSEQIEAAMDLDPYLDGKAMDSVLEGTEMEVRVENGHSDPLIGIVALTYSVTYRTTPGVSEAVDDFRRVKATHQIVGADEDNAAHDEFVVQETPP